MNKKTTLAALVALGFTSIASAANYEIRITGSTAGRSSVHTAIQNILTGEVITQDNAALGSANRANFVGTIGADTYTVRCSWSGSAAGVQSLDQNNDVDFMSQTGGGVVSPTSMGAGIKAHLAFSDVFQSSTLFTSQTLTDQATIVLPFRFLTTEGSPITNVQAVTARALYATGEVPLALFTGNTADENASVVCTGRDNLSGTRITTMAEIGYGVFNNVSQYQPTVSSGVVTALGASGNGGFSSGSGVATVMGGTTLTLTSDLGRSPVHILGYAGISDANTALTNGALSCTYNGVAYTADNVRNGIYTLWGYLHLFNRGDLSTVNPQALTFATSLKTQLASLPGSSGLDITTMKVSRTADGGAIAADYF